MKVSELAKLTGVSVHRLRRYEEHGLIRAERNAAGYREFSQATVREVIFIAMSRDLGFALQAVGEVLPSYRAGTLTIDAMVASMQSRIGDIDAQVAAQLAARQKLVSHMAWLQARQRVAAQPGRQPTASTPNNPTKPWPKTPKAKP